MVNPPFINFGMCVSFLTVYCLLDGGDGVKPTSYEKKGPESQQVPYDQILQLLIFRTLAMNGYMTSCAPF